MFANKCAECVGCAARAGHVRCAARAARAGPWAHRAGTTQLKSVSEDLREFFEWRWLVADRSDGYMLIGVMGILLIGVTGVLLIGVMGTC